MKYLDSVEIFFSKSHIVEYGRVFGKDNLKKLLAVFGGTTIRVPSVKDVQRMEKELAIFKILSSAEDNAQRKILRLQVQAKFGVKKKDVSEIYRRLGKAWRQYQKAKAEDRAVSKHRRMPSQTNQIGRGLKN